MNRVLFLGAMLISTLGGGTSADAKVDKADDTGFVVSHEIEVSSDREELWRILVTPSRWWNGEHSWSGQASNFFMTPRPGGCFCEHLPTTKERLARGFVEHAHLIYADPETMLRMSGVFGPLQSEALTGTMTFSISSGADPTKSKIKMEYIVGGYSRIPLKSVAPVVDKVLGEQMDRLKTAVESEADLRK